LEINNIYSANVFAFVLSVRFVQTRFQSTEEIIFKTKLYFQTTQKL